MLVCFNRYISKCFSEPSSPFSVPAIPAPVPASATPRLSSSRDVSMSNAGMSESEALQAALRLSANDTSANGANQSDSAEQEALDFQLALMMQQEQYDGNPNDSQMQPAAQRRRVPATGSGHSSQANCSMM